MKQQHTEHFLELCRLAGMRDADLKKVPDDNVEAYAYLAGWAAQQCEHLRSSVDSLCETIFEQCKQLEKRQEKMDPWDVANTSSAVYFLKSAAERHASRETEVRQILTSE